MKPDIVEGIATEALAAFDTRRQIEPFTERFADLDAETAYAVMAAIRKLREARGETPVGRKIGFTNRDIWAQYNIDAPIFGDMYDHTVRPLDPVQPFLLAPFREPLIEPEIAVRFARAPETGMDERALMDCIGWVAHGFEIVQSIYPGWRFKVADTIAGLGMHGAFRLGAPLAIAPQNRDAVFDNLTRFTVTLSRDGSAIETGSGSNVLGGPLSAVRHLVDILAGDPYNPPLAAGEIVTTGTLTRAYPVKRGEIWSTGISGIPLAGLGIRFG
jgi:2-oxo-3-hexenedioate decarboxylase